MRTRACAAAAEEKNGPSFKDRVENGEIRDPRAYVDYLQMRRRDLMRLSHLSSLSEEERRKLRAGIAVMTAARSVIAHIMAANAGADANGAERRRGAVA